MTKTLLAAMIALIAADAAQAATLSVIATNRAA